MDCGSVMEQSVAGAVGAAERSGIKKNKGKIAISSHSEPYMININNFNKNDSIVKMYYDWSGPFVKEYGIHGLQMGTAQYIYMDFWPPFAEVVRVVCIREVFENGPATASR